MGDKTGIEWTEATWTPLRAQNKKTGKLGWHCTHVTEACRNCYAESINLRLGTGLPFKPGHLRDIKLLLDDSLLTQPLRWKRPRQIFVFSMSDLFGEFMTDEMVAHVFAIILLADWHQYQVLTKRPKRAQALIVDAAFWLLVKYLMQRMIHDGIAKFEPRYADVKVALPHVMIGTSICNQPDAESMVPVLLQIPGPRKFVSYEPAVGPVDLTCLRDEFGWIDALSGVRHDSAPGHYRLNAGLPRLDWVIAGGESGKKARPAHPAWFRSMRDQCAAAGLPFFFKQWGEWEPREQWSGHLGGGRFETMIAIMRDGSACPDDAVPQDVGAHRMARVGKKKAGAMLDGREQREMP